MIKNTFAPDSRNEYFTENEIMGLCRMGFPISRMPKEAREVAERMVDRHDEKCADGESESRRIERLIKKYS
ncbi:MAG: hypothetical protein MPJ06_05375 [Nitrosopumilus sp.]|nr:hypothetical protein [Nitrosopumilus sp.]